MGIDINYLSELSSVDSANGRTMGEDTVDAQCWSPSSAEKQDAAVNPKEAPETRPEGAAVANPQAKGLMTTEDRVEGIVELSVYVYFIRVGGPLLFTIVAIIAGGAVAINSYASFYLADWGEKTTIRKIESDYCPYLTPPCDVKPLTSKENIVYLNFYALLSMVYLVATTFRTGAMVTVGINASRLLHSNLLRRVLAAPVAFFDTTPLGRILNRFSADITQIDERLGYTIGKKTQIL